MDYCDTEWFALETTRDHSVILEIASKYCVSDSFVDYDGHSISSKGFLPTVVDIIITLTTELSNSVKLRAMPCRAIISTTVSKNPLEEMEQPS